ncbi:MAG: peptide ABC transporter substrate-binding protein [Treponema sp.]|nr:peptide ABC transporter substrate-binding protein [Treponema sp.]
MELEGQKELEEKSSQPKELQKVFKIVEAVGPHELNPQITTWSSDAQILNGLYEGLFSYHPVTLEPEYALAQSYKISRDKKRWSISLRNDARFSNGDPITAQAVRDSFLQLLSTPNAPYASLLDIIRGAKEYRNGLTSPDEVGIYVTGEYSISLYLTKPANYLPRVLCHSAFSIVNKDPYVYSGPFILSDVSDNTYILTKNPCYWDAKNVSLENIVFYQSNDEETNNYLYNNGLVDWVTTNFTSEKILDKKALQVNAVFGTSYYFFKSSEKKPSRTPSVWDHAEFRNAVLEAFPWDDFHKTAMVPATTLVYPLAGYPQIQGFSYTDQLEASLLMKEAREKYNIPAEEIIPLTFAISDYTLSEDKLELFREALLPLGVELHTIKYPSTSYVQCVSSSEADLYAYTWIGDFADPLTFLELFRGDSTMNDSGWKNDAFDSLLEQAALVSDKERPELLGQAEEILLDSGIVIPIYHPISINAVDPNEVGGWSSNAFDIHPLKYLYKKVEQRSVPGETVVILPH